MGVHVEENQQRKKTCKKSCSLDGMFLTVMFAFKPLPPTCYSFLSFLWLLLPFELSQKTTLRNVLYVINVRLAARSCSFQRHAVSSCSRKDPQVFRRPLIQGRKNWCRVSLGLLETRLGAHSTMWSAISWDDAPCYLRFLLEKKRTVWSRTLGYQTWFII